MIVNIRNCKYFDTCYWIELAKKHDDQHIADVNCEICKIVEPIKKYDTSR